MAARRSILLIAVLIASLVIGPAAPSLPAPASMVRPASAQGVGDVRFLAATSSTITLTVGSIAPQVVEITIDQLLTIVNNDTRTRRIRIAAEGTPWTSIYLPLISRSSGASASQAALQAQADTDSEIITLAPRAQVQRSFAAPGNQRIIDIDTPALGTTVLVTPRPLSKDGAVHGQVLDYKTKAPITGARIKALNTMFEASSDAQGNYSLPLPSGDYTLVMFANGYTFANRQISVQSYTPAVVETVELVPLDTKVTAIGSAGGTAANTQDTTNVIFASGAVSMTKAVRLTVLPVDPTKGDYSALPGPFTDGRIPLGFVQFEPDGTTFDGPVTWTIDYSGPLSVGTPVPCFYWLEKEARWGEPVPGQVVDLGNGKKGLRATLPHFSSYGFSAPPPPEQKPPVPPDPKDAKDSTEPDDNPQAPKNDCSKGSQINLISGELCQTIGTLGLPSIGGLPTQITAKYRSLDLDSSVTISTSFRLAANSIFPSRKEWEFQVAGVRFRSPNRFSEDVRLTWDGRDANGRLAGPGIIEATLIARWTFITELCGSGMCTPMEVTYPVGVPWPVYVRRPDLSPTGLGWFGPHDTLLVDRGKYVTIIQGDGRQVVFELKDGRYLPPTADFSTLTHNADGTWIRNYRNGSSLHFNADGRLSRIADRYGNFQAILYESNGKTIPAGEWGLTTRIRRIIDTSNNSFDYAYDASGWLASITDSIGRVYRYEHDSRGHLTAFVDPLGQREAFTYDARGLMTSHTDQRNFSTSYTLDDQGRVVSRRWPTGTTLNMTYSLAQTTMRTDRGAPLVTTLDRRYSPITYYNGVYSSTITYNDNLLPEATSQPPQVSLYDEHGNIIKVIAATEARLERGGPFDQVSRAVSSDGSDTHYNYDTAGNLLNFTDALGQRYEMTYDSAGQPITIRDPLQHMTTIQYNGHGQVISITDPLKQIIKFSYDAAGNLQQATDALNRITKQEHDALNRLTAIVDALNGRTSMQYDADGNLTRLTDASGRPISYTADSLGRLASITQADGGSQRFSYDPDGNLKSLIDARNQTVSWEYDTAGRTTRKTVQGGPTVGYGYDNLDQVTSVNDGTLNTAISYVPDTIGHPLRERQRSASLPLSVTVDYDYGTTATLSANASAVLATASPLPQIEAAPIVGPQATPINTNIITHTTWTKANSPYVVSGVLQVTDLVTLTIEPGVDILFQQGAGLSVFGTLIATGTANGPIRFLPEQNGARGYWTILSIGGGGGVGNLNDSDNSRLSYVTIDGSGRNNGTSLNINFTQRAPLVDHLTVRNSGGIGIRVDGPQQPLTIDTATIEQNARDGIWFNSGAGDLRNVVVQNNGAHGIYANNNITLTGSIIANNGGYGIFSGALGFGRAILHDSIVHSNGAAARVAFGSTLANMTWEGNARSELEWVGTAVSGGNYTWEVQPGVTQRVLANIQLLGGATLTVAPGLEMRFEPRVGLKVTGGTLDARGTPTAPIRFLPAISGARGSWCGIAIDATAANSGISRLSSVTIDGAGCDRTRSLSLQAGTPQLDHVTIQRSGGDALFVSGLNGLTFTGLNFVDNTGYALNNSSVGVITATLSYWGAASGPYHPALNPGGTGQRVTDGVVFKPWSPSFLLPGNARLSDMRLASNGNRTQIERYSYDAIGQLRQLQSSGYTTYTLAYSYDAAGQLIRRAPIQGVPLNTIYRHDAAGQLTEMAISRAVGSLLNEGYSYDAAGNLTRLVSSRDGTTTYSYDVLNRLTGASGPGLSTSYGYDAAGNRTSANGMTYSYDAGGRLISASDGTSYDYDAAGNLASRTKGGQRTTFTWDGQGRLIRINNPNNTFSAYAYDDWGRRISKRLPDGTTIYYVYRGLLLMQELDSGGGILASYTYDGLDRPVSMWRGGQSYYYLLDRLGSIVGLTNAGGTVVATYRYDPWGNLLSSTGSLANPFRFTGREYDIESGLYFYRARYYDSQVGRFISRDPIGIEGGVNLYAYVNNNPTNFIDSTGLLAGTYPVEIAIEIGLREAMLPLMASFAFGYTIGMIINYFAEDSIQAALTRFLPDEPTTKLQLTTELYGKQEAEYKAYKARCGQTPPSGLNRCEEAQWRAAKARDCALMRAEWDRKYRPGLHTEAISQSYKSEANALKDIAKYCPPPTGCN
jgi:RHS repeat-associated protein